MDQDSSASQHETASWHDFFSVAERLGYLSQPDADRLRGSASRADLSPEQAALRDGSLDAVQIDVVGTLLRPDEVIPGYTIEDVLGRGGMGVVFRAKQNALDRTVALKTVLVSQVGNPMILSRFEQEARIVGKLRHPNIVTAYDFGRHDGRLFFAMEYVEGEDAEKLLSRSSSVDEFTTWHIIRQSAAALHHAMQESLVHRDIKPGNLLLLKPPAGFPLPEGVPMVKVADFGLALLTTRGEEQTRLTADHVTVGSPHYVAPEQLAASTVDHRADIYSLGVTAYQLLSGVSPFAGQQMPQIIARKLSNEPFAIRHVCQHLTDESCKLVLEMTTKDPNQRVADYDVLLKRIDDVLSRLMQTRRTDPLIPEGPRGTQPSIMATPPAGNSTDVTRLMPTTSQSLVETPPSISKPSSSRRRLLWLAGLGAIVVGAVVAFLMLQSDELPPPPDRSRFVEVNTVPLYNGRSLDRWQTRSGAWSDIDDGGARVITSNGGVLARAIPGRPSDNRPPPHWRLVFAAKWDENATLELHFGIWPEPDRNGRRNVLRLESKTAAIGTEENDEALGWNRTRDTVEISTTREYHTVQLERLPSYWFALVDGKLVAQIPYSAGAEIPEFRFRASGGQVWISDVILDELEDGSAEQP